MNAPGQRLAGFGIDLSLPHNAAERYLDMVGWAAEAVVQLKMPKGGVEVVIPEEADRPAAKPNAFGIGGWATQNLGGLRVLIDLFLPFLPLLALASRLGLGILGVAGMGQKDCHRCARGSGHQAQTSEAHGGSGVLAPGEGGSSLCGPDWAAIAGLPLSLSVALRHRNSMIKAAVARNANMPQKKFYMRRLIMRDSVSQEVSWQVTGA
jgi:hypothetical protein